MSNSPGVPLPTVTASTLETESVVVPVIEESLVIDKRQVDQGGWRVTKSVNVRDELVDEPLIVQQVDVERRAIGKLLPSMEAPPPRQEGDTWIVPVVEEVLVTEKRLMLKEEIRITRIDSVHRQPQRVSLRSEDISIERLEPSHPLDLGSR